MRAFLGSIAVVSLVAACGAGGSSSAEPRSQVSSQSEPARESEADVGDTDGAADATGVSSKPRGPSCDDGTCSVCGDGICPAGWYCDEKASGGAACSWLAECASKATCGCVTRVLGSGCKCREEGGGLRVSCD